MKDVANMADCWNIAALTVHWLRYLTEYFASHSFIKKADDDAGVFLLQHEWCKGHDQMASMKHLRSSHSEEGKQKLTAKTVIFDLSI